jgi:hypothetical protein
VRFGDVDSIGVAQNRNRWRALVNSVLNLGFKLSSGLTSSGLRVVLNSIELVLASRLHLNVTLNISCLGDFKLQ